MMWKWHLMSMFPEHVQRQLICSVSGVINYVFMWTGSRRNMLRSLLLMPTGASDVTVRIHCVEYLLENVYSMCSAPHGWSVKAAS
jgi:hypothetical protein